MAAPHAGTMPEGLIDGVAQGSAILPAILDGIGTDAAESLDALLSSVFGGEGALAALAAGPTAVEPGLGWTMDTIVPVMTIDASQAMLMHCDAVV